MGSLSPNALPGRDTGTTKRPLLVVTSAEPGGGLVGEEGGRRLGVA